MAALLERYAADASAACDTVRPGGVSLHLGGAGRSAVTALHEPMKKCQYTCRCTLEHNFCALSLRRSVSRMAGVEWVRPMEAAELRMRLIRLGSKVSNLSEDSNDMDTRIFMLEQQMQASIRVTESLQSQIDGLEHEVKKLRRRLRGQRLRRRRRRP
jgi:hypothetical protein